MVRGASVLLSCILISRYKKDQFYIFDPQISVFLFVHRRVIGSGILQLSVGLDS